MSTFERPEEAPWSGSLMVRFLDDKMIDPTVRFLQGSEKVPLLG